MSAGQGTQQDPEALRLATETTAAIQKAMTIAAIVISTAENRPLRQSDMPAMLRAGMAGWEMDCFRILGDESYPATLRGRAMKVWSQNYHTAKAAARKMAEALVGTQRR